MTDVVATSAPVAGARRGEPSGKLSGKLLLACATWVVAVVVGNGLMYAYAFTPGRGADAPASWPRDTSLIRSSARPTLVMAAHPHCSCTRASIAELARLMARLGGQLEAQVLFVAPTGSEDDWEKTDLWQSAAIIPGVDVVRDGGGVEAARFGAHTSGQTLLYAVDGRLLFQGGITPTRSHEGDSVGRQRIISLVTEGRADRTESAVFGCALEDSEAEGFVLSSWRM